MSKDTAARALRKAARRLRRGTPQHVCGFPGWHPGEEADVAEHILGIQRVAAAVLASGISYDDAVGVSHVDLAKLCDYIAAMLEV